MPTSKPDDQQVHELRDLEVQEVSLVDRPANKRKFLVVKNAEAESMIDGSESIEDGEEATPVEPTTEGQSSNEAEVDGGADTVGGDEFEEVELSGLVLPEDVSKVLGGSLMRAARRLTALAQAVDSSEKGGGDVPPPLLRQIASIARTLGDVGPKTDVPADDNSDESKKEQDVFDVERAAAQILDDVEKAGRKMSRSRLRQLRAAREALDKLLNEVDDEDKSGTKKSDGLDTEVTDLKSQVSALINTSEDLKTIVKSQSDEIKRLKSCRPSPNSATVEDEDSSQSVKKSVWPSNMNEKEEEDIIFR